MNIKHATLLRIQQLEFAKRYQTMAFSTKIL